MKYILIVALIFTSGCMTTDSYDHQPLGVQPFYAGKPPSQAPNILPPNSPPDFTPTNQPDFIPVRPLSNIFVE